MPFKPGQSGNPAGKKPGTLSKDRKNYLDLQVWGKFLMEKLQEVKPEKAVDVALGAMSIILTKVNNIPQTPMESVENVEQTMEMIKALEEQNAAQL